MRMHAGGPTPSWMGALFLMLDTAGPITAQVQFLCFLTIWWPYTCDA